VAVLAAGAATLPGYGVPFAWLRFAQDLAPALQPGAPVDGRGPLLPEHELATFRHWLGLAHLLLLTDGVGVLLLLVCGVAVRTPAAGGSGGVDGRAAAAERRLSRHDGLRSSGCSRTGISTATWPR
jgi:hypothetical protein